MIAVGTRPAGGGQIALAEPPRPGEPTLRWMSRANSIEGIERELARIWAEPNLAIVDADGDGEGGRPGGRHIAARTSVMNLVVVARQPEVGERSAETISRLTGRHPSRTLIIQGADPDGPPWIDARIQAHCVMPRPDAPETCTELIFLTAGGETGRHLFGLVGAAADPRPAGHGLVARRAAARSRSPCATCSRRRTAWSSTRRRWSGDGVDRLVQLAGLYDDFDRLSIRDFALVRQSRWREAIATVFDHPDFLPFLHSVRRIAVTYATHDETGAPGTTNIVKPLYHVAWLASRLGMRVATPLVAVEPKGRTGWSPARVRPGEKLPLHRGLHGAPQGPGQRGQRGHPPGRVARCRPGRRCGSRSSPSGAAPSSGPTSRRRPRTSTCTPGSTASRRWTARSRRRAAARSTCSARRSRSAGATRSTVETVRMAAALVGDAARAAPVEGAA